MATINLLRCNRWEDCSNVTCQHYEPHPEKVTIIAEYGVNICQHDRCKGRPAQCMPCELSPTWEL